MGPKPKPIEFRFFSKVNKRGPIPEHRPELGPCWLWTGTIKYETPAHQRYGLFKVRGKNTQRSHRVSWMIHRGPIPDGKCVLHKCDNSQCVNPDHLWIGTRGENIKDMVSKNRQAVGGMFGKSNLTVEKVLAIKNDPRSQASIAKDYGICRQEVSHIKLGRIWSKAIDRNQTNQGTQ